MPLPEGGKTAWPPSDIKPYIDQATAAAAWWSGDVDQLKNTSDAGGTTGRRRFWQRRKQSDQSKATSHLHAPLAGDIAAVSAELLFGDPPALETDDTAANAELENLTEKLGLPNVYLEAAETTAATGGCYLRAAWDTQVADHALTQTYPQTHAVPDFRYGRLVAATLWEDVHVAGAEVWRHLERHEKGRILHGLYVGSPSELGTPVPLAAHPQTETLTPEVVLPGRLADRLMVRYVPNVLPNRRYPWKPIGRPDWSGAEDFLDAVDEAWTSLMRDVRLGQAHITVPQEWLEATGGRPGQTTTLDMDTEVFTAFNIADSQDQASAFTMYQPDIRTTEHVDTLLALTERIVSAAGYSPQTFGLHIDGNAQSGTALRIREGKTDKTVAKKQRYWAPAVQDHVTTLLDIGAEVFGKPTITDPDANPVRCDFPELSTDPGEQALWIKTLRDARALSVRSAVKLAQPDLDDTDVDDEVAAIEAENQVADPFTLGRDDTPAGPPVPPAPSEPDEFGRS